MKKIFACALIVCLMLTLGFTVMAAKKSVSNIHVTVSARYVHEGDTLTVTLSTGAMRATTFTGGISFSRDVLECTSVKGGTTTNPCLHDTEGYVARLTASTPEEANGNGNVGFFSVGTKDVDYVAGDFAVVTLVAKKTGSARITVYEDTDGTDAFRSADTPSGVQTQAVTVLAKGATLPTQAPTSVPTQVPTQGATQGPKNTPAGPQGENTAEPSAEPTSASETAAPAGDVTASSDATDRPGTTDVTAAPSAEPEHTTEKASFPWLIPVIIVAVVLVVVGIVVFAVKKRKK